MGRNPAFEKTPIMVINTTSKIGLEAIRAAGLSAAFEFEAPFSPVRTLQALKPFL